MPFTPLPRSFWLQIESSLDGCWLWTGLITPDGYGRYGASRIGDRGTRLPHRLAYLDRVGPIPHGYQVDHKCHDPNTCTDTNDCLHRRCINPDHLSAVSPQENVLRSGGLAAQNVAKTECPRGHPYTDQNTSYEGRKRRCRTCRTQQVRQAGLRYRAKKQAAMTG